MTPTGSAPWQPPRAAAVGDFNADGKQDALIVDGSNVIRYLAGNGDGTFARTDVGGPALTTTNTVGLNPSLFQYLPNPVERFDAVRVADVDGDGKLDAVLLMVARINWNPYSFSTVLINKGNDAISGVPQFDATHYALNFYDVRSLTVGDINGDARPDYIVGSAYSGLYIHLNNGSGSFAISQVTNIQPNAGNPAVGPGVIADLNGDGKGDFIVTSGQANSTNIFLANASGTLQMPTILTPAASSVAAADLDKINGPDLILGFQGSVSVALNTGNGTFGTAASYSTGANSWSSGFFISDLNGDNKLDVAASLSSAASVAILTGNGDGTLGAASLFGGVPNPMDVTLADFTSDAKVDIASVSANGYGGQNFGVLTNTTVFAPPLPTQTLTILGGNGGFGEIAANVEYYNPVLAQWQPSYLVGTHQWGQVLGTSSWINYKPSNGSDPGAGPTTNDTLWFLYRVRFTVPADAVDPKMMFSVKADNFVQVGINGITTGGSPSFINNTTMPNVITGQAAGINADAVFSQAVRPGENTITLNVGDWGGLNGFNFRIDLTMKSSGPLEIVPVNRDTTAPAITAPADITAEATSATGAVVTFTATATDDFDGPVAVVATPASGSTFPIGVSSVNLTATDAAGNNATASFTVTVQDTIAPVVTPAASIVAEATSAAGAAVAYPAATATDAVGVTSIQSNPTSGSTFPLGLTRVTTTARDAAGNTGAADFTVTVVDTTAPAINAPAPLVVECVALGSVPGTSPAILAWLASATASDSVDPSPTLTHNAPATCALGTTIVTFSASDAAGNRSSATSTIQVVDTTAPTVTASLDILRDDDDDDDGDDDDNNGRRFVVRFSCADGCSPGATATATINGISVTNGQIVKLVKSKGRPKVRTAGRHVLKIKAPAFELAVTCKDASGNQGRVTVRPVFPPQHDDDDVDHDDDRNKGNNDKRENKKDDKKDDKKGKKR